MTEFRQITPEFSVAPQLTLDDIARAAANGFKTILNNRQAGETPDQPTDATIRVAVEAAGMTYRAIPFMGPPPPAAVAEMATMLEGVEGPILAYCASGWRSVMVWAMAQALSGTQRPDEIVALAEKAGYDLSRARPALETLAPKS